jgi:hypothetical protein
LQIYQARNYTNFTFSELNRWGYLRGACGLGGVAVRMEGKLAINRDAISIPSEAVITEYRVLTRTVAAISLVPNQSGVARLGPIRELQQHTKVGICGLGFNDRTVKIVAEDQRFYFVFLDDLNAPPIH